MSETSSGVLQEAVRVFCREVDRECSDDRILLLADELRVRPGTIRAWMEGRSLPPAKTSRLHINRIAELG